MSCEIETVVRVCRQSAAATRPANSLFFTIYSILELCLPLASSPERIKTIALYTTDATTW